MNLVIAEKRPVEFCKVCGSLLFFGVCKRLHKEKGARRGRFSGKSKSINAFGKY